MRVTTVTSRLNFDARIVGATGADCSLGVPGGSVLLRLGKSLGKVKTF